MALHHPIHAAEHGAHQLHEIEQRGEAPETPLLAILGLASFLIPLAALMIGTAFLVAWLVTGSAI
jgi:hypothetical protein